MWSSEKIVDKYMNHRLILRHFLLFQNVLQVNGEPTVTRTVNAPTTPHVKAKTANAYARPGGKEKLVRDLVLLVNMDSCVCNGAVVKTREFVILKAGNASVTRVSVDHSVKCRAI